LWCQCHVHVCDCFSFLDCDCGMIDFQWIRFTKLNLTNNIQWRSETKCRPGGKSECLISFPFPCNFSIFDPPTFFLHQIYIFFFNFFKIKNFVWRSEPSSKIVKMPPLRQVPPGCPPLTTPLITLVSQSHVQTCTKYEINQYNATIQYNTNLFDRRHSSEHSKLWSIAEAPERSLWNQRLWRRFKKESFKGSF